MWHSGWCSHGCVSCASFRSSRANSAGGSIVGLSLHVVRNHPTIRFGSPSTKKQAEALMPWQIAGDYFETCSCDYVCPCVPTNLAGKPTKEWCNFAMVFHIEKGQYDTMKLDGLTFALIGHAL